MTFFSYVCIDFATFGCCLTVQLLAQRPRMKLGFAAPAWLEVGRDDLAFAEVLLPPSAQMRRFVVVCHSKVETSRYTI